MNLDPARFSLDEHQNQTWTATVEAGTTLKDILQPDFFANVANKMRQYDRIYVRIDTGEWYAELLVLDCGKNWAKTYGILKVDIGEEGQHTEDINPEIYERFTVQHRGPHLKWCVIRKSDKEAIKEMCATRSEAQSWLASYAMTL